jgi:transcriptional regulator with XRE-family HTH domain
MTLAEKLAKALDRAEHEPDYWRDIAITDFTRDLHARMQALHISQGELARRMGTSRPYVTKLLAGSNFTLQTMVKIAMALDAVVRVRLEGNEDRSAERCRVSTAVELKPGEEWKPVARVPEIEPEEEASARPTRKAARG